MKHTLVAYGALALLLLPPAVFADDAPAPQSLPQPVNITLDVETQDATLFDGPLSVAACPVSPGSATSTVSAYCALEQAGFTNTWSWYGDDAFLDSTNGVANDNSTGAYWTWFSGLDLGAVALNKHELTGGETLLLTIGRMPLKLSIASSSPEVDATTSVSVMQFGFDSSFNPVWSPAASSTIHLGAEQFAADPSGTLVFAATSTDPLNLYATEDGFLPSAHFSITPTSAPTATSSTPTPTATSSAPEASTEAPASEPPAPQGGNGPIVGSTGGGGGGGGSAAPQSTGNVDAAVAFLLSQEHNGSFGSALLNDWAVVALAGAPSGKTHLGDFSSYLQRQDGLTSVTDFERRAIALSTAGIDPNSEFDPIQHIVLSFDGVQVGDPMLVNDDVFALIALAHAGYASDDGIIKQETAFVLSRQDTNGSWDSVDLTAAAAQALAPFSDLPGVSKAIGKARAFLVSSEDSDGCFGNVYSTSWALQAIAALHESPSQWTTQSGATPLTCLGALQQSDGGFEASNASTEDRIWATAYAIPALEGFSWGDIMHSFPKKQSVAPVAESASATAATTTTSSIVDAVEATSSLATTTGAVEITTSTPPMSQTISVSTSTREIALTKSPATHPSPTSHAVPTAVRAQVAAAAQSDAPAHPADWIFAQWWKTLLSFFKL